MIIGPAGSQQRLDRPPLLRKTSATAARRKQLHPLSLGCLRLAAPHASALDFRHQFELLCSAYSERTVFTRIHQLRHEGFITDGLPRTGYLTEKGRAALQGAGS